MKPDKNNFIVDDYHLERFENLYARYRCLFENPIAALPMIIINVSPENMPTWQQQLNDPLVMLKAQLETLRLHFAIEDDCVPVLRVNFGTGQVAAAFGCQLIEPSGSLPAVKGPVIKNIQEIHELPTPGLDAGWYPKLKKWTEIWQEHLPEGIHIQHPDIQSPFNTAHLVRGNDIFTDFYDNPEEVGLLLKKITDYMIDLIPYLRKMIHAEDDWFFDWGSMWKGTCRISNCSTDMIGPELYLKYVLPQDMRFIKSAGGGRIHYCGTSGRVIGEFLKNSEVTGLDCDAKYHDIWDLAKIVPENLTLVLQEYGKPFPHINRLLAGDWPAKKNVILITEADSVSEAKEILTKLRLSIPD